jgi:hypothetical protein
MDKSLSDHKNKTTVGKFFSLYINKEKIRYISSFCSLDENYHLCYINKNLKILGKQFILTKFFEQIKKSMELLFLKRSSFNNVFVNSRLFEKLYSEMKDYQTEEGVLLALKFISWKLNKIYFDNSHKNRKQWTLPHSFLNQNLPILACLLSINKNLEFIDFSEVHNHHSFFDKKLANMKFLSIFDSFKYIDCQKCWKSLNMSNLKVECTESILTFVNSTKYLRELKFLNLSKMKLSPESLLKLAQGISELISLEYFNISDNILDRNSSPKLFSSLSCLENIQKLEVEKCFITNLFSSDLSLLLDKQILVDLNISHNNLRGELPLGLVNSLKISKIKNLDLMNCNLESDSIITIMKAFYKNLYILSLNLRLNNISDIEAITYIEKFQKNKKNVKLKISSHNEEDKYTIKKSVYTCGSTGVQKLAKKR